MNVEIAAPSPRQARRMARNDKMTPSDFAPLYPPYIWIPASAGMTEESVRLRRTGGLGVPPQPQNPPKSPFAKGGLRGLKRECRMASCDRKREWVECLRRQRQSHGGGANESQQVNQFNGK
jgi:hypothetical protein